MDSKPTITRTHVVLSGGVKFPYEPVDGLSGPTGRFTMEVPRLDVEGQPCGSTIVPCVGYVGLRNRAEGFAPHADKLGEWR